MRQEFIGLGAALILFVVGSIVVGLALGPEMVACSKRGGVMVRALTATGYTCVVEIVRAK